MPTHKKDLERASFNPLHRAVVVTDDSVDRGSVFIDGRELIVSTDGIDAHFGGKDSLHSITITILAESIEVISWDEMEKRAH